MFTYSFFLINFAGMKILITGATGFIGSFIVEEALNRGMEVWAAVRGTSSRQYVSDERINFIELNLDSEEQLRTALAPHKFDYVVHAAGVTKCLNRNDFFRVNTEGTKHLVNALLSLQMPMKKFVYLSSLSVFGPAREQMPYREITDKDTPVPNTAYGQSKLAAENFLHQQASLPYVILRPTGVYGPRERDYFMMAKSMLTLLLVINLKLSLLSMLPMWCRRCSLHWNEDPLEDIISLPTGVVIRRRCSATC